MTWRPASLVLALACGACASDERPVVALPVELELPPDGLPASCHPFRSHGACMLPYPSSAYLEPDASTETGHRVALVAEAMPIAGFDPARPLAEQPDVSFADPEPWNRLDGFSWATPILAYFPERIDVESLPSQHDFDASVEPGSATLILDLEAGELVHHFSELDVSADIGPTERQPIMIRPAVHLRPNRRYAVAVTRAIRTVDGAVPTQPPGFSSALAGAGSDDPRAARVLAAVPEIVAAFEAAGVARDELLLAWDFHTQSLGTPTRSVLAMRDAALAAAGPDGIGYTITSVETAADGLPVEIHKRIRGTFTVPSFLSHDDRTIAEVALERDADGSPVIRGVGEYPFELVIPARAATDGPFPLLVYGHGLLGGAEEISGRHVRSLCNDKGYLCIGTDWIGLSESEAAGVGANAAALSAIKDLNRFSWVGDRLQQALVNFMVLTRTARRIAQDPQARVAVGAGAPESALAEPFEAVYYGISQGGIMGTSLVAYSPDIEKGVVQVGGSAYSLMIQRSVNWNEFYPAIFNAYPDRIDQQLVMALWQPMFDFSEGSGTAWAQGVHDPLPGTSKKHLLLQIAVGDSQVANLAAEIQARTLGLGLLAPSAKPVWGLEPVSEGADAALVAWDLERTPPPDTNATPPTDNDVHGDVRFLPENQEQTDAFLKTGKVKNTCGGPCSFPDFVP